MKQKKSQIPEANEIWGILKEASADQEKLRASQEKTDEQLKETGKLIRELRESQKETSKQIRELREGHKEFRESQKATDAQIKETDKQLKKTDARFNSQWGRLVESLVKGKLVKLLKGHDIKVTRTLPNAEASYEDGKGEVQYKEFDIIVANGSEIVVVEVKTTLTPDKVKYFMESGLIEFKKYFPIYKSHTIYGAVAYLKSDSQAHLYAERQGLFVIKATGDSASIINKKGFKPKPFPEGQ